VTLALKVEFKQVNEFFFSILIVNRLFLIYYLLFQKLQSWLQLSNGDWELVKIISTSGTESVISLPDGKVRQVTQHFFYCILDCIFWSDS
jgi:hypothetical protein